MQSFVYISPVKLKKIEFILITMASHIDSDILSDRVEFKIFAAEKHLNNLQEIQSYHLDAQKVDPAIRMEIEIDCFLAQILGTLDCLLLLINTKLELGIASERVDLATIQSALNARTKNIGLLTDMHQASAHNGWLWVLKEFRNLTMQRPSKDAQYLLFDDIVSSTADSQSETIRPSDESINKNLIRYFQQSLQRVRELVNSIRMKEPMLK
ncbi:MAG: hypothetical protein QOK83_05585 [Nitrososphaeraceae archaeon]|nr:hypothetical protein [Nitrososphaeraceae archaeon]MDW0155826.1 hypothetical protein [Nitrososphaeraceae archaeon]